jgi:hypothetical protein
MIATCFPNAPRRPRETPLAMPHPPHLKPTHKAIQQYHAALKSYSGQHVDHESALETAFSGLLAGAAAARGWTLIPKLKVKRGGKTVIPDGTVRDDFLTRAFSEAKDNHDVNDDEARALLLSIDPLAALAQTQEQLHDRPRELPRPPRPTCKPRGRRRQTRPARRSASQRGGRRRASRNST